MYLSSYIMVTEALSYNYLFSFFSWPSSMIENQKSTTKSDRKVSFTLHKWIGCYDYATLHSIFIRKHYMCEWHSIIRLNKSSFFVFVLFITSKFSFFLLSLCLSVVSTHFAMLWHKHRICFWTQFVIWVYVFVCIIFIHTLFAFYLSRKMRFTCFS